MKKVLVPTDFSDNAWDALTYAIRLYDDIPCCFHLLNTFLVNPSKIPSTAYQLGGSKIRNILRKESDKELGALLKYLSTNLLNDKHEYKAISMSGTFVSAVKSIVDKDDIDIIIMGTTGATGAKEIFMGSNTVKLIKNIDMCPIISVPRKFEYQELEKVVLATDLKRHFNAMELNDLKELQALHGFNIKVLHIKKEYELSEVQQENMQMLTKLFDKDSIDLEQIESDSNVSEAINTFSKKNDVDLICMLCYEHSFIEKLLNEPIIKKVSFHCEIPLITIPV